MIPTITLSNNEKIPVLGLGTWELNGKQCVSAVKTALKLGYRHIDTANFYQNQKEIGEAIKDFDRSELFLTSKVEGNNQDRIIEICDKALKEFGTDYIDLFLLHWPNRDVPDKKKFKDLKKLVGSGKVRSIGISNFNIHHVQDALAVSEVPIVMNQVEFHPFLYQKELLEFCKKKKIAMTAYCPIARGKVSKDKTIIAIAEKHDKTPAQVSLRWLIEHGTIVIPKSGSEAHQQENMDIFDFELDKDDMNKLDNLSETRLLDYDIFDLDY